MGAFGDRDLDPRLLVGRPATLAGRVATHPDGGVTSASAALVTDWRVHWWMVVADGGVDV